MMQSGIAASLMLAIALTFAGCATAYTYGGIQYQSRAAAEDAQRTEIQTILAGVEPRTSRIPGRAVVIVPDSASFRHRGFTAAQNSGPYGEEQFDYVTRSALTNFRSAYETLEKARLFDSVEYVETAEIARPNRNDYDHFIWFKLVDAETAGWLYYTPTIPDPVPAQFDTTVPKGIERANAWLKRVADVASSHTSRASSPSRIAPGSAPPAIVRTLN